MRFAPLLLVLACGHVNTPLYTSGDGHHCGKVGALWVRSDSPVVSPCPVAMERAAEAVAKAEALEGKLDGWTLLFASGFLPLNARGHTDPAQRLSVVLDVEPGRVAFHELLHALAYQHGLNAGDEEFCRYGWDCFGWYAKVDGAP